MKTLLIMFLVSVQCFANQKIETRIKASKASNSSTLMYHYDDGSESIWSTDVVYTGTRSKVEDVNEETEITRDLQWVNSWNFSRNWFIELATGGSNTKVNKIRTGNLDLTLGKTYEDFYFLNWNIAAGVNNIKQTDAKNNTMSELSLVQEKSGFQIGIEPFDKFSISIFHNKYRYNKNVDQAILSLQSEAAIQRYGTAFSDQLSSLINKEYGLNLAYRFSDDWRINLNATKTEDAPEPKVKGQSVNAKIQHKFNLQWDGSVLIGSSQYESTTANPSTDYSYIGLSAGFSW